MGNIEAISGVIFPSIADTMMPFEVRRGSTSMPTILEIVLLAITASPWAASNPKGYESKEKDIAWNTSRSMISTLFIPIILYIPNYN
jgi:hypothetical protein